jgi:hypothetical protein
LDLLTNLAHNSKLHLITSPSLISTLYKTFPACSVFTSSYLVTTSNNAYFSDSVLKSSLNGSSFTTGLFSKVKVKVTLGLAVYTYSQSICTVVKPLETQDQRFFKLNPCCNSPYVTFSDEKMGLSLMNMLGLSSSVRIAHIACYWKFFLVHYIQVLCQYRLCKADHA